MAATALVAVVALPHGVASADLLLFSPDWNRGNLGMLSAAMRSHLAEIGPAIGFKAFARYDDFRSEISTERAQFLSAPGWIELEAADLELRPLARPVLGGAASYRKVLLVGPGVAGAADLSGGSIAIVSHGGGGELLTSVLGELGIAADAVRVIPVPKDIDALLALGFGQVDAALVTMGQLARLAAVNPAAADRISSMATTASIPYPLVYATRMADAELTGAMVRSIEQLARTHSGRKALGLLGYDGYEIIDRDAEAAHP